MKTDYKVKPNKTLHALLLWMFVLAFGLVSFKASAQFNSGFIIPSAPVKICPTTTWTYQAGNGLVSGANYQLYRNGSPLTGQVRTNVSGVVIFNPVSTPGNYQVYQVSGAPSGGTVPGPINGNSILSLAPVLPTATVDILHEQNSSYGAGQTIPHYICGLYTNQTYWVDTTGFAAAGIAVADYIWTIVGVDDDCQTVNLTINDPGNLGLNSVTIYWYESVLGYLYCTIKTQDNCYFDTKTQYAYMTPAHGDQFDFVIGSTPPWRVEDWSDEPGSCEKASADVLHICEDPFDLTLDSSKLVNYPTCPNFPGAGQAAGYQYVLFIENCDQTIYEPIDTLFGTGNAITFEDLVLPDYVGDTAFFTVWSFSTNFNCAFPMGDTVYVVKDYKPMADAGEDQEVSCEEECATFNGHVGIPESYKDVELSYEWSFTKISTGGTDDLMISGDSTFTVCLGGTCDYGKYELVWTVQNYTCEDTDTAYVSFYEKPMNMTAGDDQRACDTWVFTLEAIPATYCSDEIDEERYAYWTGYAADDTYGTIEFDYSWKPDAQVTITPAQDCGYGIYYMVWNEYNGTCWNADTMTITIDETPQINILAEDASGCDQDAFSFEYAYTPYCQIAGKDVERNWTVTAPPGNTCTVTVNDNENGEVGIFIDESCVCPWGVYTIDLVETNGVCTTTDQAVYTNFEPPTGILASAGSLDTAVCAVTVFNLDAVGHVYCQPNGLDVSYLWSYTGPCSVTFGDETSLETTATINPDCECYWGVYTFTVTEFNGDCSVSSTITVNFTEDPVDVYAGPDAELCLEECYTMLGVGHEFCQTQGLNVSFLWTKDQNPGTVTFDDDTDPGSQFCFDDNTDCPWGLYTFFLTEYNGVCEETDTVVITRYEDPVDVFAGPDTGLCLQDCYTMLGVGHVYCQTEGLDVSYLWTKGENPGTVTFDDPTDPASAFCFDDNTECPWGYYTFYLTEFNGTCEETDSVIITRFEYPEDVYAGVDDSVCDETVYTLNGVGHEYCQTEGLDVSYLWTAEGPCDVTFTSATSPVTGVAIDEACACPWGVYTFTLTETNGECVDSDQVVVWFFELPEEVYAGADADLCEDECYTIYGGGHEYCQVGGLDFAYTWGQSPNNPVPVTFNPVNDTITEICFTDGECAYGEFYLSLTETNGTCSVTDTVLIRRFEQPTADAGDDFWTCMTENDAFTYYIDPMPFPTEYCYTMSYEWTKSCGPGYVEFMNPTDPFAQIGFGAYGHYEFIFTEFNSVCTDSDTMVVELIEQPVADFEGEDYYEACDDKCAVMGVFGVIPYTYEGTEIADDICEGNYLDNRRWEYVDGPCSDPASVVFEDETDPATEICVSYYGIYTFMWIEQNGPFSDDPLLADRYCADTLIFRMQFTETPVDLYAGDDQEVCGNCTDLEAVPHVYEGGCNELGEPNGQVWEIYGQYPFTPMIADTTDPVTEVCVTNCWDAYEVPYEFVWRQWNGSCEASDTVEVIFHKVPDPYQLYYYGDTNNSCYGYYPERNWGEGYIMPGDLMYACAFSCQSFYVDFATDACGDEYGLVEGWTYEWSVVGPAGTYWDAEPGYYEEGYGWHDPSLYVCWGECCDTALIYLTVTTPDCEVTYEYKVYVHHTPDADIIGDDPVEVSSYFTYAVEYGSCRLYEWQVEQCGEIISGQGTNEILVHWLTHGVGEVEVEVLDTCTGCCSIGHKDVMVYPQYTLGDGTLSGQVLYDKPVTDIPLNGVELTLWNNGVPVFTTTSHVENVEIDSVTYEYTVGYYEFSGINETTQFELTAEYSAPWYGANATDALAIELNVIGQYPITWDALNTEAGNVNASANGLTATDALWVKQRAISMVNYFPAGDWAFVPDMLVQAGDVDIFTLNYGDVNRSNFPPSKDVPALVKDGIINVVEGQEFELPIRVADAADLGAVTFNVNFNSELIEVLGVTSFDGMISNISSNNISAAWSSTNPISLNANDVVLMVRAKALGEISGDDEIFTLEYGTELADPQANVLGDLALKTFGISTDIAPVEFLLGNNRPNPFNNTTEIDYALPETGKVRLSVTNLLGSEVAVIVDNVTQDAGTYTVTFNKEDLKPGVYMYKIVIDGMNNDFTATKRMVISH